MFPKSIRKKITLGFFFLLICIVTVALLTYEIVKEVEKKVEYVEIIDDFLNKTLEVRRFEKNYFLYGKNEDYQENMTFLTELVNLLFHNIKLLRSVMTHAAYNELWDAVHTYQGSMKKLKELTLQNSRDSIIAEELQLAEETIRLIGKNLTDTAEKISSKERSEIRRLLGATGRVLFFSALLFILLCIIIATLLGRSVVKSLGILEDHTRKISQGEYVLAQGEIADEEINTLLQAFNRMTNELRSRQRQLVRSEKLASLGTLLSGVAHELNNPLSNVSTSAQILVEELEEEDLEYKKDLIDQILEQSDRARDIVRTLLEFSRVRDFNRSDFALKELMEETIILLRGQVPSRVEIRLEIPSEIIINADKQRLQQVFLNLLKNALDVLEEDGKIWISCRHTNELIEKGEIEILIEDNGPGIPNEIRKNIFDPFYTTKEVGHGSGLGLFIVHDIIEKHGGSIRVDSRPGLGTTFVIWLPSVSGENI